MNSDSDRVVPKPIELTAIQALSKEARRLHRLSVNGSLADALPVLRRLIATATMRDSKLTELNRHRDKIRRKHIFRMLAVEAGFTSWESYRQVLGQKHPEDLTHYEMALKSAGSLNCWFSNFEEAREFAVRHGGTPIRVGQQGVVVPEVKSIGSTEA